MVFFTCNACGESLKKAQVEKHVNMCRGCQVLSCIDCGKDFWGDDYRNHVKCISEDQKYGGKGYAAKANKGDVKQQQWIERVHSAMNTVGISAKLKDILNQVSSYDNVPRKKLKFQNWMKNSLKIHDRKLHDQVWDIFSAAISNQAPEAPKPGETTPAPAEAMDQTNGSQLQNGTAEEPAAAKKKLNKRERKEARQTKSGKKTKNRAENGTAEEEEKMEEGEQACAKKSKRKRSCEADDEEELNGHTAEEETSAKKRKKSKKEVEQVDQMAEEEAEVAEERTASKGKFNWKGTIKAVLRQAPDEGLSVKKVRKKVLAAYYSFSGESNFKSEGDLLALFNKKINGNPKFKVLKDKVRLVK